MSVLTVEPGAVPAGEEPPDTGERHRLTAVTGLAALSLDAMASVAYGPEAIVLALVVAGTGALTATLAIVQRGLLLATVLRARTDVVVCMLPYRLSVRGVPTGSRTAAPGRRTRPTTKSSRPRTRVGAGAHQGRASRPLMSPGGAADRPGWC